MNTFRWAFNQLHHENLNESLSKPCRLRTAPVLSRLSDEDSRHKGSISLLSSTGTAAFISVASEGPFLLLLLTHTSELGLK